MTPYFQFPQSPEKSQYMVTPESFLHILRDADAPHAFAAQASHQRDILADSGGGMWLSRGEKILIHEIKKQP
jgi:hypothetical protein